MRTLEFLIRDENGQSMAEYGLIVALIAAVCVGAFKAVGKNIYTDINTLANNISPH